MLSRAMNQQTDTVPEVSEKRMKKTSRVVANMYMLGLFPESSVPSLAESPRDELRKANKSVK